MNECMDECVEGGDKQEKREAAADGRAAGVGVGRDWGFHRQRSTKMLSDSAGMDVWEIVLSPH